MSFVTSSSHSLIGSYLISLREFIDSVTICWNVYLSQRLQNILWITLVSSYIISVNLKFKNKTNVKLLIITVTMNYSHQVALKISWLRRLEIHNFLSLLPLDCNILECILIEIFPIMELHHTGMKNVWFADNEIK